MWIPPEEQSEPTIANKVHTYKELTHRYHIKLPFGTCFATIHTNSRYCLVSDAGYRLVATENLQEPLQMYVPIYNKYWKQLMKNR